MSASSPYVHGGNSLPAFMNRVSLALLPGLAAYIYYFGLGVVIHCLLAVSAALALEAGIARLRGLPSSVLTDGSVVVLALLLAVAIPPAAPWWITLAAIGFAVVIVKHAYGGLGNNLFNPAMAGYALVIVSFPAEMNLWPDAEWLAANRFDLGSSVAAIFNSETITQGLNDALSGATPLNQIRTDGRLMLMISEMDHANISGRVGALRWEWINFGYLMGGCWLLWKGVIRWQIPAGVLGGLFCCATVMYWVDSDQFLTPWFHLFSGSTMLAAFFIATDPITSPTNPSGRLVFGCCVGVIIYLLRVWSIYPDGVAFAVLTLNAMVPMIDRFLRPPILGEER